MVFWPVRRVILSIQELGLLYVKDLNIGFLHLQTSTKIVSEYEQEILQSQTADKPVALQGRVTQQSQDTRKTNKAKQPTLSLPNQDDCRTRMDTK